MNITGTVFAALLVVSAGSLAKNWKPDAAATSKPSHVLTEAQLKDRAENEAIGKALVTCEVLVRNSLKNPSSYKRINNRWALKESERLVYSATNSFGAVVRDSFDCSPFVTAAIKELG